MRQCLRASVSSANQLPDSKVTRTAIVMTTGKKQPEPVRQYVSGEIISRSRRRCFLFRGTELIEAASPRDREMIFCAVTKAVLPAHVVIVVVLVVVVVGLPADVIFVVRRRPRVETARNCIPARTVINYRVHAVD